MLTGHLAGVAEAPWAWPRPRRAAPRATPLPRAAWARPSGPGALASPVQRESASGGMRRFVGSCAEAAASGPRGRMHTHRTCAAASLLALQICTIARTAGAVLHETGRDSKLPARSSSTRQWRVTTEEAFQGGPLSGLSAQRACSLLLHSRSVLMGRTIAVVPQAYKSNCRQEPVARVGGAGQVETTVNSADPRQGHSTQPSVPPLAFCPPRPQPTPSSPLPRPRPKLITLGMLLDSAAMLSRDMPCATSSAAAAVGEPGPAAAAACAAAAAPSPPAAACACCWTSPSAVRNSGCALPPAAGAAAAAAAEAGASSAAIACRPCPFWNCGSGRICAL